MLIENYWRILPPAGYLYDTHLRKRINNVPLTPLTSPKLFFKNDKILPSFYLYDARILCKVRNQGLTSFCWAYSITSMLSDLISIRYPFAKWFSIQELITCYPYKDPITGGAAPESVLSWLAANKYKLAANDDVTIGVTCDLPQNLVGVQVIPDTVVSLTNYVPSNTYVKFNPAQLDTIQKNVYNIKRYIHDYGPVITAIEIYDDLYNFVGDKIYVRNSFTFQGGHAIEIIGWCDIGVDKRINFSTSSYWICRNSWGETWSKGYNLPGYFAIRMGTNELGIESRVTTCLPNIQNNIILNEASITSIAEFLRIFPA